MTELRMPLSLLPTISGNAVFPLLFFDHQHRLHLHDPIMLLLFNSRHRHFPSACTVCVRSPWRPSMSPGRSFYRTFPSTVRFFKLESITLAPKKNSEISHNISISPAIVRSDTGKLFSLIETRSNLEKICKTDFKSLREIPIYSLLNIFARYGFHCDSPDKNFPEKNWNRPEFGIPLTGTGINPILI
jgi:hypothetical protein